MGVFSELPIQFQSLGAEYGVYVYFAFISAIAVFLFWRSVQRTCCRGIDLDQGDIERSRKEWGYKSFDFILLSFGTALIFSRAIFILYQPGEFLDVRWFWIPYERIDGEVFFFASFPWLFFRVWDGGLLLAGMVLGWFVSAIVYSRIMNIRWGAVSNAVADFLWFLFLGTQVYHIYDQGHTISYVIFFCYTLLGIVRWFANRVKARQKMLHRIVSFVWKVSIMVGIPLIMLVGVVISVDDSGRYLLSGVAALTAFVGVWVLAGDALEFFQILLPKGGRGTDGSGRVGEGAVGNVDPFSRQGDWRRFTRDTSALRKSSDQRMVDHNKPKSVPRDFSRSYRDYSRNWLEAIEVLWVRLTKKRDSDRKVNDE